MPWIVPSSPNGPCSALKATSGLRIRKHRADIAIDVHAGDAIAFGLERVGAGISRRERHRPLRRKPTQQHRNVLRLHALQSPRSATLIRG